MVDGETLYTCSVVTVVVTAVCSRKPQPALSYLRGVPSVSTMAASLLEELDDWEAEALGTRPCAPKVAPTGGRGRGRASSSGGGRGRGLGRSSQATSATSATDADETPAEQDDDGKKCNFCRRWRSFDDYHKNSATCKECRSKIEACQRRFAKAKKLPMLEEMRKNNPKEFERVVRAFDKACPKDTANHNRRGDTINVLNLTSEVSAKSGQRYEAKTKMMWEREYYEEAAKTAMGNLTSEEAARQWNVWKNNPDWPRDNEGPRGFLRLEVPIGDFGQKYSDLATGRRLSGLDKTKKRADEDDFDNMLQSALGGHNTFGGVASGLSATVARFSSSVAEARSGQQSQIAAATSEWASEGAFTNEGTCMDDLDTLLEKATAKKKGKIDNDDGEAGEEAEEEDDKKAAASSDAHSKWYDVERHVARSVRAWKATVAKTVEAANDCVLRAKACISEFIGTADEDRFKSEIKIVRSRLSALEARI